MEYIRIAGDSEILDLGHHNMSIFNRKKKQPGEAVQKTAGFVGPEIDSTYAAGAVDISGSTSYRDYIDAYRTLPWLYAGANAVAVAAQRPKLRIYRKTGGDKPEEVQGEPINDLLERPNPFLSYQEMIQILVLNLRILGEAYLNLVGSQEQAAIGPDNPPIEMWWMKPENIKIVPDKKDFIKKYIYAVGGEQINLDPSEVIHFKLANPDSYFQGLGSMDAAKNSAIQELNAVAYNKAFMQNDAVPFGIFHTPRELTKEQRKQYLRTWNNLHRGTKNAGGMGFTWGEMEFKDIGKTPKDAQYNELLDRTREEQLATLGVPPSIVGLLEFANYSNMEIQQKKMWEDTVMPILDLVADKLTLNLTPHFDERIYLQFDYSEIKALQEDEERLSKIATSVVANGIMSPDEARQRYYGMDPGGGDAAKRFIPLNWIPLTESGSKAGAGKALPGAVEMKEEEPTSFWAKESRKKILWNDFIKRVKAKEKALYKPVEAYLRKQVKEIMAEVQKFDDVAHIKPGKLFDPDAEAEKYANALGSIYESLFQTAGEAGMDVANGKLYNPDLKRAVKQDEFDFEMTPELKAAIKALVLESGAKINKTTMKEILALVNEALAEGLTVGELTANIEDKMASGAVWKSQRIGRTEMGKVENYGQMEGYKQSKHVDYKGWLSAYAEDTREAHKEADAQYRADPIPLEEPFIVGGEELMYPGDPAGSPGNIINCLCSTYPVVRQTT